MDFAATRRLLAPWLYSSALAALLSGCASTDDGIVNGDTRNQVIISVRDQKLTVIEPDHHRVSFPISTSKYGFGDRRGSYATPLGELAVAQKIGTGAPSGSVFKSRVRTGEIVKIDAPGRDAIVTRIIALRGLEAGNKDAWARGIYIHGTPEERNIGRPTSYGCIRMRSRDVITLYDMIKVGARVQIIDTTANKAIAANIVTPVTTPATPPVVVPPAVTATTATAIASNDSPGAARNDPATTKALVKAVAADHTQNPASVGSIATEVKPATALQAAAPPASPPAPTPPPVSGKKEWAGAPSKLLAKANEAEARNNRNPKTVGILHPASSNGTTEASYNTPSGGRSLNRGVLDSL